MGMHFGLIAAQTSVDELLNALFIGIKSFNRVDELSTLESVPDRVGDEPPLVVGDLHGIAFLMDPGLLVSTNPNAIVAASGVLGAQVAAVGAETFSGTYWLTVAERGTLSRLHWNSMWVQSEPYDVGSPLTAENEGLVEDIDGVGLLRVFNSLGFDYSRWSSTRGPFSVLAVDYRVDEPGPIGVAQAAFEEAHSTYDPNVVPKPVVVRRRDGSFDVVAAGSRLPDGTIVQASAPEKPGFLGKLLGR